MKIPVLDHGYVRLVDHMGSDLTVVNAARASFAKQSQWVRNQPGNLSKKDQRLITYLTQHGHLSPFRHVTIQLEVKAPLMVARQWWKYVVGGDHTMDGWNETSRRYVAAEPEFYIPAQWRRASEDKKQGSGAPIDGPVSEALTNQLRSFQQDAAKLYDHTLALGVVAEQARLFLPMYGLYTSWFWTTSLQGAAHFLRQRLDDEAQVEIQVYAKAVHDLLSTGLPELQHSLAALIDLSPG